MAAVHVPSPSILSGSFGSVLSRARLRAGYREVGFRVSWIFLVMPLGSLADFRGEAGSKEGSRGEQGLSYQGWGVAGRTRTDRRLSLLN
jgi:hypothetical protein